MGDNNLKIADEEYIFAEKILSNYIEVLSETAVEYMVIINKVQDGAVQAPGISSRLAALTEKMMTLQKSLNEVSASLENTGKQFIKEIDEKDQFIY